jgi:hypothetical protein
MEDWDLSKRKQNFKRILEIHGGRGGATSGLRPAPAAKFIKVP